MARGLLKAEFEEEKAVTEFMEEHYGGNLEDAIMESTKLHRRKGKPTAYELDIEATMHESMKTKKKKPRQAMQGWEKW